MVSQQKSSSVGELSSTENNIFKTRNKSNKRSNSFKMHHSHSTPAGVDGGGSRTPPLTPKKGGKMLAVRVQMLDDTITMFQIQAKALGRVLFDQVCKQLHLLEADYFGLEYQDLCGIRYWLDLQKPVSRQLGFSLVDPFVRFCVKFYTPDPGQLEEEFTRYLFCLQIKRDLAQGHLQCNDNTAALMASYIVQAECGDFVAEDYPDHTYLSSYKFVPHQDHDLEMRIMENHKRHAGQSPAEADLNLLETARRCELYGMKMHTAKDHEGAQLNLSVAHMGIVVFQHFSKINTFSWANIRKISFKRKRFLIKLHPDHYGFLKDVVEFFFDSRNECKNFWKKCVEHHGFFRCAIVKYVPRHKTRVLSRGSSFRYSGKTQKQIVEFVRDNYVKRQTFQRSGSFRHSAINVQSTSVGASISAHPLLPLADPELVEELDRVSRKEREAVFQTTKAVYHHPEIVTHSQGLRNSREISMSEPLVTQIQPVVTATTTIVKAQVLPPPVMTNSQSNPRMIQSVTAEIYANNTGPSHTITTKIGHPATPYTIHSKQNNITADIVIQQKEQPHIIHTDAIITDAALRQIQGQNKHISYQMPQTITTPTQTQFVITRDETTQVQDTTNVPLMSTYKQHKSSQTNLNNEHYLANNHIYAKPVKYFPKSEGCLNFEYDTIPPYNNKQDVYENFTNNYDCEYDMYTQIKPKIYTNVSIKYKSSDQLNRSSSCRNLNGTFQLVDERKAVESPITRYNDYKNVYIKTNEQSEDKIYSSSYPGTTAISCRDSVEDPGNYELSQEDVSHDSYELLEKSDDDISGVSAPYRSYRHSYPSDKIRSSSLDSGNYIQTTSDSDSDERHLSGRQNVYRDDSQDYKCASDVHYRSSAAIFMMDYDNDTDIVDPMDLPREINPPKSDGSFFKTFKLSSRASSLESKSDYYESLSSSKKLSKGGSGSRTSSVESKSDAAPLRDLSKDIKNEIDYNFPEILTSIRTTDLRQGDDKTRSDDLKKASDDCETINYFKETSHVHSVSLQNVETELNIRNHKSFTENQINTLPRMKQKGGSSSIESPSLPPYQSEPKFRGWNETYRTSTTSQSENIFSFDDDKIKQFKDSLDDDLDPYGYPPITDDVFQAKIYSNLTKSDETLLNNDLPIYHQTIERTKSDPNTIANRQKLTHNARRHTLIHQKSFELTPAESSDEDYLYRQIPSAPPLTKSVASRFEMPTAEFGHFDILRRDLTSTKFEVPKTQFEILGAKNQFDLMNLPPKDNFDIPYTLHKRHIMNGTAPKLNGLESPKTPKIKIDKVVEKTSSSKSRRSSSEMSPKIVPELYPDIIIPPPELDEIKETTQEGGFLFTQNVDLSHINPITLEIDKTDVHFVASPKRDITKFDPNVLEALNLKLSRIESDSPTMFDKTSDSKLMTNLKNKSNEIGTSKILSKKDLFKETKPKPRIIKLRKSSKNKSKIRITSFSSDDESLDSDDVFGTSESAPKLDYSPPQQRKEMESILKYESERKTHMQYTMSSTEIEGSPPQPRKTVEPILYDKNLDAAHSELRRISERSLSIPSSEDDYNIKATNESHVFTEPIEEKSEEHTLELEPPQTKEDSSSDKTEKVSESKVKSFILDSEKTGRKGSPGLFAHARLNLSEGTGVSLMQRQSAVQSPTRRTKSLDTAVVSVTNLPPPTAFSSKDDTLEVLEEIPFKEIVEENKKFRPPNIKIIAEKKTNKIVTKKDKLFEKQKSPKLKSPLSLKLKENVKTKDLNVKSKEKSKSFEKVELKRAQSKERSKSQDDGDLSVKRKEKQQMLYETAIKQTKTLKSPVKEMLPTFPIVEDSVSVSDGKLEIKIDVANYKIPDDAIIITKSPKKLDKKLTKSLELNFPDDPFGPDKSMGRLGTSLDLERKKKDLDSEKPSFQVDTGADTSEETSDIESETNDFPGDEQSDSDLFKDMEISEDLKINLSKLPSSYSMQSTDESVSAPKRRMIYLEKPKMSSRSSSDQRSFPRFTSEEESLTDISDIRGSEHMLKKLSTERSRSEDTTSWLTFECEEVVGGIPEEKEDLSPLEHDDKIYLTAKQKFKFSENRSRSSDTGSCTSIDKEISPVQQKEVRSDESSVSCTLIRPFGLSQHIEQFDSKEQLEKEISKNLLSSDTCTAPTTTTLSEKSPTSDDKSSKSISEKLVSPTDIQISLESPEKSPKGSLSDKGPRSPLKRSSPVQDESSSSDEIKDKVGDNLKPSKTSFQSKSSTETSSSLTSFEAEGMVPKLQPKSKYNFEQKWLSEAELNQKTKVYSKLSGSDKSASSLEESGSNKSGSNNNLDKPRISSLDKLSTESKTSVDTESSSGSLGLAFRLQKTGEVPLQEPTSTWKPFPLESSGSSSIEDVPQDYDLEDKEYLFNERLKADDEEICSLDSTLSEANLGYPDLSAAICGIGLSSETPVYTGPPYLTRTLSRISERSSSSEKSSIEDNSKQFGSNSINEEETGGTHSSEQLPSISSDTPSEKKSKKSKTSSGKIEIKEISKEKSESPKQNISSSPSSKSGSKNSFNDKFKYLGTSLQRQISDDRRTSAEMADISLDDIEFVIAEDKLKRQNSDDTIIEEETIQDEEEEPAKRISKTPSSDSAQLTKQSSSQESDDWPLPELPKLLDQTKEHEPIIEERDSLSSPPLITNVNMSQNELPQVFGLRGSLQSEDSGQWPSPPSSATTTTDASFMQSNVKTFYIQTQEKAHKVNLSSQEITPENDDVFLPAPPEYSTKKPEQKSDDKRLNKKRKLSILSKQQSIRLPSDSSSDEDKQSNSPPSDDDPSSYENATLKSPSAGKSLSEYSNSFSTVIFQNLSGSKSYKGLKDEDNSLFDNVSLSEWSSSNSQPLASGSSKIDENIFDKSYTKSTERPMKIPLFAEVSETTSRKSDQLKFQKSISYEIEDVDSVYDPNSQFKTVPLVRSHRSHRSSTTTSIDSKSSSDYTTTGGAVTTGSSSPAHSSSSSEQRYSHSKSDINENEPTTPTSIIKTTNSYNNSLNNNHLYEISPVKENGIEEHYQDTFTTHMTGSNSKLDRIDDKRKNRWLNDKSYFIAKEILMTERTYKKDLEVINTHWRNEVNVEELGETGELLLSIFLSLSTIHSQLAKDLELCLQSWDGRINLDLEQYALGNILLNSLPAILPLYEEYLDGHADVLNQLELLLRRNEKFEQTHANFENQKICYLPFTTFILKPLHRLLHYQTLLDRLLDDYDETHADRSGCVGARAALSPILLPALETLKCSENLAILHELQRDLINFNLFNITTNNQLTTPSASSPPLVINRKFIRLGCLLKYSRKGFQQRMFFLFSDILLYTSRQTSTGLFRVHGHMPLRGVMIDQDRNLSDKSSPTLLTNTAASLAKFTFVIYGGTRSLTVSASSQTEKQMWLNDLHTAIQRARVENHVDHANLTYLSLKSCCSSDEVLEQHDAISSPCDSVVSTPSSTTPTSTPHHNTLSHNRNNTIVQVCWHRNTSVSIDDILEAVKNQLSGYLLRKFKNSNGWQKLWVVFTSFCLFFYKSSTDELPLASLPLLGYHVGVPATTDNIQKEFVFKLQYKNHVYFFRAESQYSFNRWIEVIESVTLRGTKVDENDNAKSNSMEYLKTFD